MRVLKSISARLKNHQAYSKVRGVLSKNAELKDIAYGDVCFVIGNGPSLKKHDLTKLPGCKIVLNSFYLHKDIKEINPDYYIFADPEGGNIQKENVLKWWSEIAAATEGLKTSFILPVGLLGTRVSSEILASRKSYFVMFKTGFTEERVRGFDLCKSIPGCQNTIAEGLMVAMYMGYKKIIILGADHDWLSHWNVDTHFYSGVSAPAIGPDVQKPYYWWLHAVNTMFQQYLKIRNVASSKGVQIFNCSEAGVLDVFPMKPLNVCLQELKNS